MKLRSRGLLVAGPDREVYVERPDIEAALLTPVLAGGNVLVLGPPGAGKTTALRKLALDLTVRDQRVCLVNGRLGGSSLELIDVIADGLGDVAVAARHPGESLLTAIQQLSRADPTCILIDGPIVTPVGRELFGRHRDELWSLEHRWALTSTPTAASGVRVPPADAFWDQVISLPPFHPTDVERLLRQGLDDGEREDLRSSGWLPPKPSWPRALVRSVRDQLEATPLGTPDQVRDLREKQAGLDRVPTMVLAELEGLRRPAAASDAELLARLGYSRAYVARALAELEELGLVVSSPESSDARSGRPRKLYEPTLSHVDDA